MVPSGSKNYQKLLKRQFFRIGELEADVSNKHNHIQWLEGEKSRLENELSGIAQERNEANARLEELKNKNKNLTNTNTNIQSIISKFMATKSFYEGSPGLKTIWTEIFENWTY